ncbi:hypothetical protein [Actinocorallia libanotica]|uniref:Uncharacterized protein n=1 Tax=Actinocorallia libanotica TaxID=46162 RepID=A0ABP4CE93_9ACTN
MPYRRMILQPLAMEVQAELDSADGKIHLRLDSHAHDYHIIASPGYRPSELREILRSLRLVGLVPISEDECEPDLLDDGSVRIYLVHDRVTPRPKYRAGSHGIAPPQRLPITPYLPIRPKQQEAVP